MTALDPRDRELLAHAEIVLGELEAPTRDAERLAVDIRRRLADEIPAPDHPDVALVFEGAVRLRAQPFHDGDGAVTNLSIAASVRESIGLLAECRRQLAQQPKEKA